MKYITLKAGLKRFDLLLTSMAYMDKTALVLSKIYLLYLKLVTRSNYDICCLCSINLNLKFSSHNSHTSLCIFHTLFVCINRNRNTRINKKPFHYWMCELTFWVLGCYLKLSLYSWVKTESIDIMNVTRPMNPDTHYNFPSLPLTTC